MLSSELCSFVLREFVVGHSVSSSVLSSVICLSYLIFFKCTVQLVDVFFVCYLYFYISRLASSSPSPPAPLPLFFTRVPYN